MDFIDIPSLISGAILMALASGITFLFKSLRKKNLERELKEIDLNERIIDEIGNGYQKLIRHSFRSLSFALCIFFLASTLSDLRQFVNPEWIFDRFFSVFLVGFKIAASIISYSLFKEISALKDIDKSKTELNEKREKLNTKLSKIQG